MKICQKNATVARVTPISALTTGTDVSTKTVVTTWHQILIL